MPYICYLIHPDQHTNAATTYPGKGETEEQARRNACYYNNQWPWTAIVPASRAPRWAQRQARDARWHELSGKAKFGEELTKDELAELESYELTATYA